MNIMLEKIQKNLSNLTLDVKPFPHFFKHNFINSGDACSIYKAIVNKSIWQKTFHSFYELSEYNLDQDSTLHHSNLTVLSNRGFCKILSKSLGKLYNIQLSHKRIDVTFLRLDPGQKIEIHNDSNDKGQAVRLVIYLNKHTSIEDGGLVMIFNNVQKKEGDLYKYFLPEAGAAFSFKICSESYHAVSPVLKGSRISLCFTFYQIGDSHISQKE